MTNLEIITNAAIAAELYTEDEAKTIISERGELPIHTYTQWRKMGYQVKRGEKSALVCDLWRWKEEKTEVTTKDGKAEDIDTSHHYKQKAYLFTVQQVEKVQQTPRLDIRAYNAMLAAQRKASAFIIISFTSSLLISLPARAGSQCTSYVLYCEKKGGV